MKGRRILIGVSGGIAAYKVCEVVSTLAKAGADVKVIVTDAAGEFVTPLTFATLSRHPAFTDKDFWQANHGRPLHIQLGEWAEVFVIAPLTANTLAKLVGGFADNLLTNTVLASNCPILLAPAMNTDMWEQPAVQRNWREVLADGRYHAANPGAGMLACDRAGVGRMAEPGEILPHIESLLYAKGVNQRGRNPRTPRSGAVYRQSFQWQNGRSFGASCTASRGDCDAGTYYHWGIAAVWGAGDRSYQRARNAAGDAGMLSRCGFDGDGGGGCGCETG